MEKVCRPFSGLMLVEKFIFGKHLTSLGVFKAKKSCNQYWLQLSSL